MLSLKDTARMNINGNAATSNSTKMLSNFYSSRPKDINFQTNSSDIGHRAFYTISSTATTTGAPPISDCSLLTMPWDSYGWATQLAIGLKSGNINNNHIFFRMANNKDNGASDWFIWKTVLDDTNYTNYTVKKDGTGATGTWGINISGTAGKATSDKNGKDIATTYLPLAGGTMTGAISSSVSSGTHLNANNGKAIINATAAGTGYNMLARMASTNGVFTMGTYGQQFHLYWTAKTTIDASENKVDKNVVLSDESGNASFPRKSYSSNFCRECYIS